MILLPLSFFDWIAEFLTSLGSTITGLVNLIWNLLGGLVDFLKVLPTVITMLTNSIGNLPDIVLPFATMSITIAVVLLVLGRSNDT